MESLSDLFFCFYTTEVYLKGYVKGWDQSVDNKKGPRAQAARQLTRKRAGAMYAKNRKSTHSTNGKVNAIVELELMTLKIKGKYLHTIQRS